VCDYTRCTVKIKHSWIWARISSVPQNLIQILTRTTFQILEASRQRKAISIFNCPCNNRAAQTPVGCPCICGAMWTPLCRGVGRTRQPCELSGRDRGRCSGGHWLVGLGTEGLELTQSMMKIRRQTIQPRTARSAARIRYQTLSTRTVESAWRRTIWC